MIPEPRGGEVSADRFVGVDYCTVHQGLRIEDYRWCEFATGWGGGHRDCDLPPLGYMSEGDE